MSGYLSYEIEPQAQGCVVYAWYDEDGTTHNRDEFAFSTILEAANFVVRTETEG